MQLTVDGEAREYTDDPAMPLLWYVRDVLGLTGAKFGCGIGACGSCTLHLDGVAVRGCQTPVAAARDKRTRAGTQHQSSHVAAQLVRSNPGPDHYDLSSLGGQIWVCDRTTPRPRVPCV